MSNFGHLPRSAQNCSKSTPWGTLEHSCKWRPGSQLTEFPPRTSVLSETDLACLRMLVSVAMPADSHCENGRLTFIHLRCWKVLPFLTIQRQRCINIPCPKDPEFYTLLALNSQKGQHVPAPEVYKMQSRCEKKSEIVVATVC